MKKKLTVLVNCYSTVGPVTASVGITKPFLNRGHRVIFLIDPSFKGKLPPGYEEFVCTHGYEEKTSNHVNPGEATAREMFAGGLIGPGPSLKKLEICIDMYVENDGFNDYIRNMDQDIQEAIRLYKPDLFLVDNLALVPAIYYSGIPWLQVCSTNPCCRLFDDALPPGASGYPADGNFDRELWRKHKEIHRRIFYNKRFNDMIEEIGYARYPDDTRLPQSQLLTAYAFPNELNYPQLQNKEGLVNLEVFNRVTNRCNLNELVPDSFIKDTLNGQFSGKWIYLAMGSMCSIDVSLMKKLIKALSTTNHKYIVSKGHAHAEYELAPNMFGERFVKQTLILPHVDLVIAHGGNNTLTETFYFGRKMLLLPVFWDQFDNAQRIAETGYGVRLDPYTCSDEDLVGAVDQLLGDEKLTEKLQKASHRIQNSTTHEQLCDRIESLLLSSD